MRINDSSPNEKSISLIGESRSIYGKFYKLNQWLSFFDLVAFDIWRCYSCIYLRPLISIFPALPALYKERIYLDVQYIIETPYIGEYNFIGFVVRISWGTTVDQITLHDYGEKQSHSSGRIIASLDLSELTDTPVNMFRIFLLRSSFFLPTIDLWSIAKATRTGNHCRWRIILCNVPPLWRQTISFSVSSPLKCTSAQ